MSQVFRNKRDVFLITCVFNFTRARENRKLHCDFNSEIILTHRLLANLNYDQRFLFGSQRNVIIDRSISQYSAKEIGRGTIDKRET